MSDITDKNDLYDENDLSDPEDAGGAAPGPAAVELPLLPLHSTAIFPEMTVSFDVDQLFSMVAVNKCMTEDRRLMVVYLRDSKCDRPNMKDVHPVGVICSLRQYLHGQENGARIMLEGVDRARLLAVHERDGYYSASVMPLTRGVYKREPKSEGLIHTAVSLFKEYMDLTGSTVNESVIMSLLFHADPGYISDYMAQNAGISAEQRQSLLELTDPVKRLSAVIEIYRHEVEVMDVERDINQKLHEQLAGSQREHILREHLRVIQSELGEDDFAEIDDYRYRIEAGELPGEVEERLMKEVDHLARQPYGSAEASVIRNYLDAVLDLPWNTSTKERLDLNAARRILDRDHYGLEKVKERIIEYLAVRCMAPEMKGGILCLVGPPGVGKTSIAISIAGALNRKLARMSLGGVHDEAEIRGHRKTYIGAMPGRIMTAVTQSKSNNPVLLLDEIDKLGSDYRGDPASALLEALDPEQNTSFRDHYLEVPFDLSRVMFITTANTTDTIPRPLLDRMEVIELTSYTDEEKLQIAKNYLLPKQRKKHGLTGRTLKVGDDAIRDIISGYTRESGVRQLERELAHVCRKTDMLIASGGAKSLTVTSQRLEELLGPRKFKPERLTGKDRVGVVNGLAWTSVGGEMLEVECAVLEGTGKIELTGNLGDVMKESAHAAVSCIRSRCDILGIDRDFYKNRDIHIHFPEGAVPKDGPSAGITIACAVISALTGTPARRDVAMTGEITITGRVLPIGGLKEKTMAALRFGARTVIIPEDNRPDLEEIDQSVRRALSFVCVSRLDDVLDTALVFPETERARVADARTARPRRRGDGTAVRPRDSETLRQ